MGVTKKDRLILFSLSFASNNYFTHHLKVLEKEYFVDVINVDEAPVISRVYGRRSILSFPFEVVIFLCYLCKYRPKAVMTAGPKLGVIFSVLLFFLPIKHLHWFTGQVWGAKINPKRTISFWTDRIIFLFCDVLFCDGLSQSKFITDHFGNKRKIYVPRFGSINGLNEKFHPFFKEKKKLDKLKVCFIGRKAKGKGLEIIPEVAKSFDSEVEFLLAGPEDLSFSTYKVWKSKVSKDCTNVYFIDGYVDSKSILMDCDILLLPSEREGFGSIVIEAQSCGVVPVCSNIYGLKDAFIDGVTGISCNSIDDYVLAINKLKNDDVYFEFSRNASDFSTNFSSDNFVKDLEKLYVDAGVI